MERDSEYNRLNSSINDSEGSSLSFRRAVLETSSDSHSNQGRRLATSHTQGQLPNMQRSHSGRIVSEAAAAAAHSRRRSAVENPAAEVALLYNDSEASPRGGNNTERGRAFVRSPQNSGSSIPELNDLKVRDLSSFSRNSSQAVRGNNMFQLED